MVFSIFDEKTWFFRFSWKNRKNHLPWLKGLNQNSSHYVVKIFIYLVGKSIASGAQFFPTVGTIPGGQQKVTTF